jgi:hypothetical protein
MMLNPKDMDDGRIVPRVPQARLRRAANRSGQAPIAAGAAPSAAKPA